MSLVYSQNALSKIASLPHATAHLGLKNANSYRVETQQSISLHCYVWTFFVFRLVERIVSYVHESPIENPMYPGMHGSGEKHP
ncbi:hypothetical protein ARMSODRAFT_947507 [Armillaria solidipes]|uniref:Uncharacterized protein n=1 Tax=Armillaria solidipes TaxID=1076256 RepID=A0A2H3C9L4_9AGAR|nr:hypothetical protein ARMSODRAFT_947507 [Armillaria solidipes]